MSAHIHNVGVRPGDLLTLRPPSPCQPVQVVVSDLSHDGATLRSDTSTHRVRFIDRTTVYHEGEGALWQWAFADLEWATDDDNVVECFVEVFRDVLASDAVVPVPVLQTRAVDMVQRLFRAHVIWMRLRADDAVIHEAMMQDGARGQVAKLVKAVFEKVKAIITQDEMGLKRAADPQDVCASASN